MTGYLKVFAYLSAGEIIVRLSELPLPGPILGLLLMLLDFAVNRQVDPNVGQIFDGISKHIAILFVPAGAGVIAHGSLLNAGMVVIGIAIVAGTLITIMITAIFFRVLLIRGRVYGDCCATSDAPPAESKE